MKNETEEEAYYICEMHIVMSIIQLVSFFFFSIIQLVGIQT